MKSVLYVGATLMIGASIYGFVDYKKTSHDKEFTKMYEEPKTTEPVTVTDPVKNENVVKTETPVPAKTTAKKGVSKKQVLPEEETVPSIKPIAEDEKMIVDDKAIEKTTVTVTPSKSTVEKKVTKPRRLSTKLFSRGALDERYVDEPKKKKN